MTKKVTGERLAHIKTKPDAPLAKRQPKTSKNNNSQSQKLSFIPEGLSILEKSGQEDYYSRFGISKIIKLPISKCQDFFNSHDVQIFKCKKVKAIQGKQKL